MSMIGCGDNDGVDRVFVEVDGSDDSPESESTARRIGWTTANDGNLTEREERVRSSATASPGTSVGTQDGPRSTFR